MTAKDRLCEVVDELSEQEAEAALRFIDERREPGADAVAVILDEAAPDDEPTTPQEDVAVLRAREDYVRGDVFEAEQVRRELV